MQMIKMNSEVVLIENKENLGFAKRIIWQQDGGPATVCLALNSDAEAGKNTLRELYDYMEKIRKIGALLNIYPDCKLQPFGGFSCLNLFCI